MSEREITREDVAARARVGKLAPRDVAGALRTARGIEHPWYRCQALATAAEHLKGRDQERVLLESLAAAREQEQANRVVTVSSWPLRVLAEVCPGLAAEHLEGLIELAKTEPHHLRRAHALQALTHALSGHRLLLERAIPALAEALMAGQGDRIDRCIRDTFAQVLAVRPDLAWSVAMHHKPDQRRSRLLAVIPQ